MNVNSDFQPFYSNTVLFVFLFSSNIEKTDGCCIITLWTRTSFVCSLQENVLRMPVVLQELGLNPHQCCIYTPHGNKHRVCQLFTVLLSILNRLLLVLFLLSESKCDRLASHPECIPAQYSQYRLWMSFLSVNTLYLWDRSKIHTAFRILGDTHHHFITSACL